MLFRFIDFHIWHWAWSFDLNFCSEIAMRNYIYDKILITLWESELFLRFKKWHQRFAKFAKLYIKKTLFSHFADDRFSSCQALFRVCSITTIGIPYLCVRDTNSETSLTLKVVWKRFLLLLLLLYYWVLIGGWERGDSPSLELLLMWIH